MGRPVILGNGSLTVGIDEEGLVHDFYYPYVGLDNLNNARFDQHKLGVWVDGLFSWVNAKDWKIKVDLNPDALISEVSLINEILKIEIYSQDFVDQEYNVLCRNIYLKNNSESEREIRVFMHQVFQISRAGRADTGLFVPEANYILDYKGRVSLLIFGRINDRLFDQFAIGSYGIEGKEGTFKDAEDGELSGSAVEHGGIDSVIRLSSKIKPNDSVKIEYWVIAADSQYACEEIHETLLKDGIENRLIVNKEIWSRWFALSSDKLRDVKDEHKTAIKKSLMIIKAHTDKRGGIIASCDSSIYNYGRDYYSYVWPRDAAYAVWPLIRLGHYEEARNLFEFCRDILNKDGYLMHKYQPDRAIGSTWHPLLHGRRKELAIQEDETAIILYMLGEYYKHSKDEVFVRNLYDTFIKPAADFITSFIDDKTNLPHASYDLWEEKFLTTTYTVSIVYRSLLTAADFADKFEFPDDIVRWKKAAKQIEPYFKSLFSDQSQSFIKGLLLDENGEINKDETIDVSSLYGMMMFGPEQYLDLQHKTSIAIENKLLDKSPSGGSPRYENDYYFRTDDKYPGNPWFVTTLWIAQYYIRINAIDKANRLIDWSLRHCLNSGIMSEQVNPENGLPVSVTPLVWSHAELINTILDLSQLED